MPLYEYQCEQCGEVFELLQKFSDEPLKAHEKCGGSVHRLISAPALQFKGSGWYITDYAKGGDSKASKDTSSSDSNGSSSKDASSSKKDASSPKSDSSPAPASTTSSGSDKK
jgi:putative FmdB family regulatory protein